MDNSYEIISSVIDPAPVNQIIYTSPDKSIVVKIFYIVRRKLVMYHVGKTYPVHTQCLIFVNGLLRGEGMVIKHQKDKDNLPYALIMATKKAMVVINIKWLRQELWSVVHQYIKTNKF